MLAKVIRIEKVLPHKNADKLEIVPVLRDRQTVVQKGQFQVGDLGILIHQGTVVPLRQEFSWLWGNPPINYYIPASRRTIHPRRFRGEWSSALLMAPSELGLDITDLSEDMDLSYLFTYFNCESVLDREWVPMRAKCTRHHIPQTFKGWLRWMWVTYRNAYKNWVEFDYR